MSFSKYFNCSPQKINEPLFLKIQLLIDALNRHSIFVHFNQMEDLMKILPLINWLDYFQFKKCFQFILIKKSDHIPYFESVFDKIFKSHSIINLFEDKVIGNRPLKKKKIFDITHLIKKYNRKLGDSLHLFQATKTLKKQKIQNNFETLRDLSLGRCENYSIIYTLLHGHRLRTQ